MSLKASVRWQIGKAFALDIDLATPASGVTALFGRSGCGKTSLLRIIAGLERIKGASVSFRDQRWQEGRCFVPLHQRRIGLVFQEHSLMPHLSVQGNLLYGYRRTPAALRRHHPDEVAELLGIADLLQRPVDQLSGGQRQRIAVGRALLSSPQLLLLDEPLAALDSQAKREIMPFFSALASAADVPIVLVTHAPDEVQRLADRVVFMEDGRITRIDPLQAALARPDSPLFSDDGASSVIEGALSDAQSDGFVRFGNDRIQLRLQVNRAPVPIGSRLRIQASDVAIALQPVTDISVINQLPVTIEQLEAWRPGRVLLRLSLADGQRLSAEVTEHSRHQLGLAGGQRVYALIKSVALLD